jgi:hypothetical protein
VLAPFNGYILDKLGYGFVLLLINSLSMLTVVLQSIPVIQLQVRGHTFKAILQCMCAAPRGSLHLDATVYALMEVNCTSLGVGARGNRW